MRKHSVGNQELALLRWVAERGGATVGEAAETYGAGRGLARSTILTMMERLRRKGYLARRQVDGVYRYTARASSGEVLKDAVRTFVERTLDGSVSPVVAYLSEAPDLSEEDLRELEQLVANLQSKRQENRS